MKRFLLIVSLCVIFSYSILLPQVSYCLPNDTISFIYGDKIFCYSLNNNIKANTQFDLNYEINKYHRFGTAEDRKSLLDQMLKIGIPNNIAINYLYPNIENTITRIEKNIYQAPRDAKLKIDPNSNKVFFIKKESIGLTLDREELYQRIISYINNKEDIYIPIKKIEPTITSSYYEKFSHLRGDFSTDISTSSPDRKHNIKNSLNALNQIEIYPNETFSFNKVVGNRTAENGYRMAKIIQGNEFVEGLGGGVCQVSSTLYNAALLSGMEIIEANKHSKQIHYVKHGFDAMVNFGSSDLKFKNTTNQKVTIITNFKDSKIRIRIFGEDMRDTMYRLSNDVYNIVSPAEEILYDDNLEHTDKVIYEDEYFYLKHASTGMEIKSYREKYVNDTLVEKELLRTDKYSVQNAIKMYGTKKRED